MPRVVVLTNDGEEIGEVEVFELSRPTGKSRYGFDGIALTAHLAEARRRENVADMVAESVEEINLTDHPMLGDLAEGSRSIPSD